MRCGPAARGQVLWGLARLGVIRSGPAWIAGVLLGEVGCREVWLGKVLLGTLW